MALTIPRNYSSNAVLTKVQLDAAFDSIETLINTTLLSGAEIQDGAIEADHLASNAVTTGKIIDGALTADATGRAKMADGFVNAAKLASDAVTTAKILDSNVTTAKIADSNVTRAKLVAVGQQVSSSSGTF